MAAPGGWTEHSVASHPCHVYEPPRRHATGGVVLYLHGVHLQTLHDHQAFADGFNRHGLVCVAPMTGPTWWVERITAAFDSRFSPVEHLLANVLPFIAERFGATPPRIGLLGTSMGGQGALRLAYKRPDMFPVVAALAPAIDYHLRLREGDEILSALYDDDEEQARQDTALLHIHPLNWPRHQFFACDPADARWFPSVDRLQMKLSSLGVPHECDLVTSGGGHGFAYYNCLAEKAIGFLAERLEREQRRLA